MIVDDRALSRHLVRQVAATPHDTVLECVSADEALAAVGIFQPDCLVMGVSHPAPVAFDAIRRIRQTYPEMRIVAASSVHESQLQQQASDAGACGYVTMENLSELFLLAAPERLAGLPLRRAKVRRRQKKS